MVLEASWCASQRKHFSEGRLATLPITRTAYACMDFLPQKPGQSRHKDHECLLPEAMLLSICGVEVGLRWGKCKFTHIYKIRQSRPCLTSAQTQMVAESDTDDDYAIRPTLLVFYSDSLSLLNSNTCFKDQDKALSMQGCLQTSVNSSLQSVNYLQDVLSLWCRYGRLQVHSCVRSSCATTWPPT